MSYIGRALRLLPLCLLFLLACGDDSSKDAAVADGGSDASRDASDDAGNDVGIDADDPDTGSDVGTDATDVDAGPEDGGFDAGGPDTSVPCEGEGTECGDPLVGDWSPCRYADECVLTGERARTTTVFMCRDGSCQSEFVVETDPSDCDRDTTSDTCMGGGEMRCCDGVCRDTFTDPNNCGACGLVCPDTFECTGVVFGGRQSGTCIGCDFASECGEPGDWTCRSATGEDHCSCTNDDACGEFGVCDPTGYCRPI